MPLPTTPLADRDILRYQHHILTCHLPRLYPALQRVQGLIIVTYIGKLAVEIIRDSEAKELARQAYA